MTIRGYVTEIDDLLPKRVACHDAAGQAVVAHVLGRRIKSVSLFNGPPLGSRASVERPPLPAGITDRESAVRFFTERDAEDLTILLVTSRKSTTLARDGGSTQPRSSPPGKRVGAFQRTCNKRSSPP